jgi:hypothetical protein
LPVENLHAVMRRLARAIGFGPGVVVAADLLDLATLSVHDVGRAVVLILHGDHDYYTASSRQGTTVSSMRTSHTVAECTRSSSNGCPIADDIYYIPYGIPLPQRVRLGGVRPTSHLRGPSRARTKASSSCRRSTRACANDPSTSHGRSSATVPTGRDCGLHGPSPHAFGYRGTLTNAETVGCRLITTCSCSRLGPKGCRSPSSRPWIRRRARRQQHCERRARSGRWRWTGLLPEVGDVRGFADAIARLSEDRALLERFSASGRKLVTERFDIRDRVKDYQALYARYAELYRPLPADAALQYGSRLDQPWMPNTLVRLVRSALRARSRR